MNAYDLDPKLYRTLYADLKVDLLFIINKLNSKIVKFKNRILARYFKQTWYNINSDFSSLVGTDTARCEVLTGNNPPQSQQARYPAPWIF